MIFHIYEDGTAGVQLDKHKFEEELELVRAIPGRRYDEKRRLWIVPQSADLPGLEAAVEDSKRQLSFLPTTR